MFHGVVLFLLGLLTGLIQNQLANPRMGLAAHLEGLMNGTFILAVGAAWSEARMSARSAAIAYGAFLYGAYGNWLVTLISAAIGTTAMTPIAGAGHSGEQWQEFLVTAGFVSVGIAMIAGSMLLLLGFRNRT